MNNSYSLFFILVFLLPLNELSANHKEWTKISDSYLFQNQYDSALFYIKKAQHNAKELKDEILFHRLLNKEGFILARNSEFDSAWLLHEIVFDFAFDNELLDMQHETNYHFGVTKVIMGLFEEAEDYFKRAADYFESKRIPNKEYLGRIYNNLAFIYTLNKDYDRAMIFLNKSVIQFESKEFIHYQAVNSSLLALIHVRKKEYESALDNYLKAIDLYNQANYWINRSEVYFGLVEIYHELGNETQERIYIDTLKQLLETKITPVERQSINGFLASYYEKRKDLATAYPYFKAKVMIEDSLQIVDRIETIANIEFRNYNDLQEQKINLLEAQLYTQRQYNQMQKLFLFIAVIVSIYLTGFILVFRKVIKQKKISEEQLKLKNDQLSEKNSQIDLTLNRLVQSEKMALLGRLSAGIAHELNNPIGAIKGNIELVKHLSLVEMETFVKIMKSLNQDELHEFTLIISEIKSGFDTREGESGLDDKRLARNVRQFFESVNILNKEVVIDYFIDLKIDRDLNRFSHIYSLENNVELLELLVSLIDRNNALNTSLIAIDRISKILGSFKTYSFKRGWEEFNNFNLASNIDTILNLHKNILTGVTINRDVDHSLVVYGIPDEMSQVWSNIISNAAYAMNYNGELSIVVRKKGTDKIEVSISDTGGGIKTVAGADIFEPFFTTKPEGEGSGLGLDISKKIIEKHGGTIQCKNNDRGAVFIVLLPLTVDSNHGES